jgi:HD-like signal output (HDOD) protein
MGISVLNKYFASDFHRMIDISRQSGLSFYEAEESVLGITHAEIGGWLGERWNLPDHLVEAITCHHHPSKATINAPLVAIIHCADVFANQIIAEKLDYDKGVAFDEAALDLLNLRDENLLQEYKNQYAEVIENDLKEASILSHLVTI